jgi:ribosomal protein L7/L12
MDIDKQIRDQQQLVSEVRARYDLAAVEVRMVGDDLKILTDQLDNLFKKRADKSGVQLTENEKILAVDNFIGAIKSLRLRSNISLKEAKDVVDAYREANR